MKELLERLFKTLLIVTSLFTIILVVSICLRVSSLTIPLLSDEMNAALRKEAFFESHSTNGLMAALEEMKWMYCSYNGVWFSAFIYDFFLKLDSSGIIDPLYLRIIMTLGASLFFISVFVFIYSLFKEIIVKERILYILVLYAGYIFIFTSSKSWKNVFNWYIGMMSYAVPLSIAFLSIALTRLVRSNRGMIISSILAFCAAGSALCIPALLCFILLLISLHDNEKRKWSVFISSLVSALINVGSPGNYLRHAAASPEGYNLSLVFRQTWNDYVDSVLLYLKSPFFGVFFIIIVYVGIMSGIHIYSIEKEVLFYGLFMFLPFVIIFPIELGYAARGLNNRTSFIVDISIVLELVCFAFVLGVFINRIKKYVSSRILVYCMIVFLFVSLIIGVYRFESIITVRLFASVKEYMEYTKKILDKYEYLKNTGVRIIEIRESELPKPLELYERFYLTEDPDSPMERWVCLYLDKDYLIYVDDVDSY